MFRPAVVVLCLATASWGAAWLVAKAAARPAVRSDPAAEIAVARAQGLLKAGRPIEALKAISKVAREGPRAADLSLVEGLALASLGEAEPARRALLRSIAIRDRQPMALKVLAAIAFSRGEGRRGLEYLARAATLDPDDFRPFHAMGEANLRLGHMDAAIQAFRAALRRKGDHKESRVGLLTALLAAHPPEDSSALVRELLREGPRDPGIQFLAARHALALGDRGSALTYAEKAIELDPGLADAMLIRAQLLFLASKTEEALAEAARAVECDPRNRPALTLLAQLQRASGQAERSRATLARLQRVVAQSERMHELTERIAEHPDDPDPRWQLGQVAAEAGARSLAAESYRAALAIDAHCRPAIAGLRALGETSPPAAAAARATRPPAPLTVGP